MPSACKPAFGMRSNVTGSCFARSRNGLGSAVSVCFNFVGRHRDTIFPSRNHNAIVTRNESIGNQPIDFEPRMNGAGMVDGTSNL